MWDSAYALGRVLTPIVFIVAGVQKFMNVAGILNAAGTKTFWALIALVAIPPLAIWLMHVLLGLAEDVRQLATPGARTKFVFLAGTLPAIIGILLIIPFRVPRAILEVMLPPVLVTVVGMAWMQTGAWRVRGVFFEGARPVGRIAFPLIATVVLLLIFQLVLRPGIPFFDA